MTLLRNEALICIDGISQGSNIHKHQVVNTQNQWAQRHLYQTELCRTATIRTWSFGIWNSSKLVGSRGCASHLRASRFHTGRLRAEPMEGLELLQSCRWGLQRGLRTLGFDRIWSAWIIYTYIYIRLSKYRDHRDHRQWTEWWGMMRNEIIPTIKRAARWDMTSDLTGCPLPTLIQPVAKKTSSLICGENRLDINRTGNFAGIWHWLDHIRICLVSNHTHNHWHWLWHLQ